MLGQQQVTATTLPEVVRQINRILGLIQQGGLSLNGLKLDRSRSAAPTGAPGVQDPNLVLVDVGGVITLYIWDGMNWTPVGSQ